MNPLPKFPKEVHQYVRRAFANANRRLGEKIALAPNSPEESLDFSLIETLSRHSAPRIVAPGWAVRIDVHFLGGMRHFYNWEIADIGILLFAKEGANIVSQKVAILQSKRLYPTSHGLVEETPEDFNIGFGRLLPASTIMPSITNPYQFKFDEASAYKAMSVGSDQYNAIRDYQNQSEVPVHYLMYNPWSVPATYDVPIVDEPHLGQTMNGGARVLSASKLHDSLSKKSPGFHPTFGDLANVESSSNKSLHGHRIEHFVADRLMRCKDGMLFESVDEESIFRLFNRRSGPIAAAFSVTIEQFEGVSF